MLVSFFLRKSSMFVIRQKSLPDALLQWVILPNSKIVYKGAAAPVSFLAGEVKDHVGDVAHDLGSVAIDAEKLIEA